MTRLAYCCNLNPQFIAPEHHKPRPSFIHTCKDLLRKRKIALWEGFSTLMAIDPVTLEPQSPRQRRFNEHRAKAMQAVADGIIHHMHITTGLVLCPVEQLASHCSLSTVSEAGNLSITRASRVIQLFEAYGLLRCERIWDKKLHMWYPKCIQVTPLFFQMIGSSEEAWQAAIRQQQGYQRKGLLASEREEITPTEATARMKLRMNAMFLQKRQDRHAKKRAWKLLQKSREEQRYEIITQLVKSMGVDEIGQLELEGVKRLINQTLSNLRKLVGYSPPS